MKKEELLNDQEFFKSFNSGEDLTDFFKQMFITSIFFRISNLITLEIC